MTYNVFGGTLTLTQSINQPLSDKQPPTHFKYQLTIHGTIFCLAVLKRQLSVNF